MLSPALEPAPASANPIRILIVDDHKMLADSLAIRLAAELDLEVLGCAFDVSSAVRHAARTRPDVVIVGCARADQSGAAAAFLNACPATQILAFTRVHDEGALSVLVDAGCTGFITQDESTADLVTAVRQLATSGSYIPTHLISKLIPRLGASYRNIGADLTAREREVLELLATGATTPSMASQLFVSVNTIRQHVQRILFKLSAHSKLEAVAIAVREGVIERSS